MSFAYHIHHIDALTEQLLSHVLTLSQINTIRYKLLDILSRVFLSYSDNKEVDQVADIRYSNEIEIQFLHSEHQVVSVDVSETLTSINWFGIEAKHRDTIAKITKFLIFATKSFYYELGLLGDLYYMLPEDPNAKLDNSKWSEIAKSFNWSEVSPLLSSFGIKYLQKESVSPVHTDRFQNLFLKIQTSLFSVSPFVYFPPPFLLKRMFNDQKKRKYDQKKSKYYSVISSSLTRFLDFSPDTMVSDRYVMSSSDKTSIASLVSFDDSLNGMLSDQSFTCLFATESRNTINDHIVRLPCISRRIRFKFYCSQYDMSLSSFLLDSCAKAHEKCNFADINEMPCDFLNIQHEMRFSCGQYRIRVNFDKASDIDVTSVSHEILARTYCAHCKKYTPMKALSSKALKVSFGKFLELLCFGGLFLPNSVEFCNNPAERWSLSGEKLGSFRTRRGKSSTLIRFSNLGGCPSHRSSFSIQFVVQGKIMVRFRRESVSLKEIAPPKSVFHKDSFIDSNRLNIIKFSADGCGPYISPYVGCAPLNSTLTSYWKGVTEYMTTIQNLALSRKNSKKLLMSKTASDIFNFQNFLDREKDLLDHLIEVETKDLYVYEQDSYIFPSTEDWSRFRKLRRTIYDRIISLDKEINAFGKTFRLDFPTFVPEYHPSFHLDSYWRNVRPLNLNGDSPSSFIAFALSSSVVRDLISLLEECSEDVEVLIGHVVQRLDYNPLLKREEFMSKMLIKRKNTEIDNWNPESLEYTSASIVDSSHIRFKYQKYRSREHFLNRDMYREIEDYNTATSNNDILEEFSVLIYHAYYFHLFRSNLHLTIDDYIDSLSCCSNWKPTGGKSNAPFFKTSDDKYILKNFPSRRWFHKNSISSGSSDRAKMKKDDFLDEECIPAVKNYLSYILYECDSSYLVKILGEYKLNFNHEGEEIDGHMIVMENLFYQKQISYQYDLKGIKTRKVDDDYKVSDLKLMSHKKRSTDITMFDKEWIKSIYGDHSEVSLSLHPHSHHLLMTILERDCDFLSRSNIIDYSLLLGIDTGKNELVVGIVDYLCEYTIWKALENKTKVALKFLQRAFREFGKFSQKSNVPKPKTWFEKFTVKGIFNDVTQEEIGEEVTIQAPEKYKQRFLRSIKMYFPHIPDKWEKGH